LNKEELKNALVKEQIDPRYYSLDGLGDSHYFDRIILEKSMEEWLVYHYERGSKNNLRTFISEDEACNFLFNWIIRDPNTRIYNQPKNKNN
jgi:hypothetical protein